MACSKKADIASIPKEVDTPCLNSQACRKILQGIRQNLFQNRPQCERIGPGGRILLFLLPPFCLGHARVTSLCKLPKAAAQAVQNGQSPKRERGPLAATDWKLSMRFRPRLYLPEPTAADCPVRQRLIGLPSNLP